MVANDKKNTLGKIPIQKVMMKVEVIITNGAIALIAKVNGVKLPPGIAQYIMPLAIPKFTLFNGENNLKNKA